VAGEGAEKWLDSCYTVFIRGVCRGRLRTACPERASHECRGLYTGGSTHISERPKQGGCYEKSGIVGNRLGAVGLRPISVVSLEASHVSVSVPGAVAVAERDSEWLRCPESEGGRD
jgi:hypothetical protein